MRQDFDGSQTTIQANRDSKSTPSKSPGIATAKPTEKPLKSKWNPVLLPLDSTFLRLSIDKSDVDDEFAKMLQNEEFMTELRFNQEFLSTLEKEQGRLQDTSFEERLKVK